MNPLLLKYRRGCLLALCALLGLASSHLATVLMGINLNRVALPQTARAPAAEPAAAGDPAAELAYILQHNLFDPTARTNSAPVFSLRQNDGETGAAAAPTNLELIGMAAAGKRSIAVLRSGQETKTYRLDDTVPGGGTLEEIIRHQVKIRNVDHSLTILNMYEGERAAPPDVGPRLPAAGNGNEVRATGDNRWVIPRGIAESVRDNLGEQLRMALMQPRIVDGRTDGFIIKKITAGSLIAKMGLRRGDVIRHVNGTPIDSPEKALQILQQLREARQLNVDLERDGAPLSFTYAIE